MTPDQALAFALLALAFGLIAGYLCGIPDREKVEAEKLDWRQRGYDQGLERGRKQGRVEVYRENQDSNKPSLGNYAGKATAPHNHRDRDVDVRRGGNTV